LAKDKIAQIEDYEGANLEVYGARVHNLKNIDVTIPRNKLTVITGLSGSGKSSLAFDVIFAEGQRRYLETFSAYARQFLGNLERPDVDKITGLSPVISIEQKTTNKNPRSTVGTITEIYDFLRLLFARAGEAYSYKSGKKMIKYSEQKILNLIFEKYKDKKIALLSPVVQGRKGHYKELFEQIRRYGFIQARVDGEIVEISPNYKVDRYKSHDIQVVIDKIKVTESSEKRVRNSVELALKYGRGIMLIIDYDSQEESYLSRHLMDPEHGISYNEPAPHSFSFNSPHGACPTCNGMGVVSDIDINKIIPDNTLSIAKGGIVPLGKAKSSFIFWQLEALAKKYNFKLTDPIKDVQEEYIHKVLFGTGESLTLENTPLGISNYVTDFEGVVSYIVQSSSEKKSAASQKWADQFVVKTTCKTCNGQRLKKESLHFKVDDKNISELAQMNLADLGGWFVDIEDRLSSKQNLIAKDILKEIRDRIQFLLDVGLDYITLDRSAKTLSGGESQRIRLATQIGSKLVNVLYILDEPSIGLHQRDNERLINALKELRDTQNTVIVVEHDKDMILAADHVIDIGPHAGRLGGQIVAEGTAKEIEQSDSCTGKYLSEEKSIEVPKERREGTGEFLKILGATGHNLKNVDLSIPVGKFICVTGVSGSGKSSLINGTLYPILSQFFYRSTKSILPYKSIEGIEHFDKVIEVNQAPIGKTPRSNPATYTNIFSDIRDLFANLSESKIRGYKPGRFSFNVKGGRCETCKGAGLKTIEMNFLPDVYVQCDECYGKRYNRETLEVRYKGKSISDVLDMTINMAVEFFENIPNIQKKLKALQEVGLGYITLGQPSTTLSGGEAQRVKLSAELSKKDTGRTLYILDEPTTGLHFQDVKVLLDVLNKIVDRGNTVIVIEHNLDVIKVADHIIDVGPEGGVRGGQIVAEGTPEEVVKFRKSFTAKFLKPEL
jgi:excinuclease ABC subunit A